MKRYCSLRWKLAGLIAGGSVLTAAIAAAGFTWLDLNRFWQDIHADVAALVDVVGDQIGPALELGDRKAAGEILNSLRRDPRIRDATLYDASGACFAVFRRFGGTTCASRPRDGVQRTSETIVLVDAVEAGGERLGTIAVAASAPSAATVLGRYVGGAGLILLLSLVVAAAVAMTLQSRVSRPILAIARFAERIAGTHRFEDRVEVQSSDELGVLVESFNAMLEEIERRDEELNRHRRNLEDEITERKRINDELRVAKEKAEDAARLKSEFLANMSHEIRTPLNGVIGMISLVLDACTDAAQREQLQVAQHAAESLVNILNDILDISKIEAGKMTLENIDFELEAVLRDALRVLDIAILDKGLALKVSLAAECPRTVTGDPIRLRQIILNLAGNAIKFTHEGRIGVTVRPGEARSVLRFEVSDTGIGIPASKLTSIFEAFTQADGSHTRRFGGTGLGLTITRRLVDLTGGRLWATSEDGRGSSFFVDLPLAGSAAESMASPAAVSAEPAPKVPRLPALRVLVAEDNLINQKVVKAMLSRQGCTVTLAVNGSDAVRQFQEGNHDLILMDLQMPEMDGLEATRLIRQEEASPGRGGGGARIPIVALTANASRQEHEQCLAGGMDLVVTKPINVQTLLEAIGSVIGRAAA